MGRMSDLFDDETERRLLEQFYDASYKFYIAEMALEAIASGRPEPAEFARLILAQIHSKERKV